MKAFKLIGASAAVALLLLTSCLSGNGNKSAWTTFAVGGVSDKTYKPILNTPKGPIFSTTLANVVDGACYSVNFEIDSDNPENADVAANGYYTATIGTLEEITKGQPIFSNVPDTAKLLENEFQLLNAGIYPQTGVYVNGYLFLGAAYNGLKDQKNAWTLSWDRQLEPVTVEGDPTYSLFLRATKVTDGTGSSSTQYQDIRAFNIEQVLKSVNNAELAKGSKKFNLKINYLSNVNEKDKADRTWKSFSIPFEVAKDTN